MKTLLPLIFSLAFLSPALMGNQNTPTAQEIKVGSNSFHYQTRKMGKIKPAAASEEKDLILSKHAAEISAFMKDYYPHIQERDFYCYVSNSGSIQAADLRNPWSRGQMVGLASYEMDTDIEALYQQDEKIQITGINSKLVDGVISISEAQCNKIIPDTPLENEKMAEELRVEALSTIAHELAHLHFRELYPLIQPEFFAGNINDYHIINEGYAFYHQEIYVRASTSEEIANKIGHFLFRGQVKNILSEFKAKYIADGKINADTLKAIHESCAETLIRRIYLGEDFQEHSSRPYHQK